MRPTGKASSAWGFPSCSISSEHTGKILYPKGVHQQKSHFFLVSPHSQLLEGPSQNETTQPPCPPVSPQDHDTIYQCPTAQQNHKDNKALKPAVFHYLVAGFSQAPPRDPGGLSLVHSTA